MGGRVPIAEDEPALLEMPEHKSSRRGCQVCTAMWQPQVARWERPDVICERADL